MLSLAANHPTAETLQAFGLGRLPAGEAAEMERHIATCDVCCARLGQVADDTLIALAREAATDGLRENNTTPSIPASPQEIPAELVDHPRYKVLGFVGSGGMGVVYKAEHRIMERTVALKVIHQAYLSRPQAVERFRREVKAAAKLSHPNIVAAHDADQAGSLHFLVTEFVDGVSLDRYVAQRGPVRVSQACQVARQVALGLQHAHERNMVHRDIKPHNLMVTRQGQIKILDFGLARFTLDAMEDSLPEASSASSVLQTQAGIVMGTPDYIAPEQIRDSRSADIRSDLYALGCTLFFLLTGRPPFPGGTPTDKLRSHVHTPVELMLNSAFEIPPEIHPLLAKFLAKNPDERFATPAEAAKELAQWSKKETSPEPIAAPPVSPVVVAKAIPPKGAKSIQASRRTLLLGASATLLLGVVGMTAAAWMSSGPRNMNTTGEPPNIPATSKSSAAIPPATASTRTVLIVVPLVNIWPADYVPLRARLEQGGVQTVTASWDTGVCTRLPGSRGPNDVITADYVLSTELLKQRDFAAVVFVGTNTWPFRGKGPLAGVTEQVLAEFREQRKPIAAICLGQSVLADHGYLQGREAARGPHHRNNVAVGGAIWRDGPGVVRDDSGGSPIITGSDDSVVVPFAEKLLEAINLE